MLKTRVFIFTFLIISLVALAGCSDTTNLELALQEAENRSIERATEVAEVEIQAENQLDAAATSSAEQLNEVLTRSAEALVDAQGEAQENVVSARGTADAISALATAEASIIPDYDTSIYGIIDEVNLNGVPVRFWHNHSGAREEELLDIVANFNATNPFGITVEATNEGNLDDIFDKMISGLTTGDLPSLTVATQNQAATYQFSGGLVSLEPYIEHPEYGLSENDEIDFFTTFLDAERLPQFDNDRYSFPVNRSMELLYYNVEFLNLLGYTDPPRTPAEFEEMACAATNAANGTVGIQIDTDPSRVASLIFASGGDIYDAQSGQFNYSSQEGIAAYELIQRLVTNGCALVFEEAFADQAAFAAQQTLFAMGPSTNLPFFASEVDASETPFEWSVAPIPYTGYEPVQNIYGASLSIPRTTPEEQLAAWLFIQFFASREAQISWVRTSNFFPVRASAAIGLDNYFDDNPAYATAFDLLKYGKVEAPVAGYDEVRPIAVESLKTMIDGEDVSVTLAELDSIAENILDSFSR